LVTAWQLATGNWQLAIGDGNGNGNPDARSGLPLRSSGNGKTVGPRHVPFDGAQGKKAAIRRRRSRTCLPQAGSKLRHNTQK
jgi:hypothetical protein